MKGSASYSRNAGRWERMDEVGWDWSAEMAVSTQCPRDSLPGFGDESPWALGRRGRIYGLIKGEFSTFYRLLVDVLDYGDSCIILCQATGLSICCMGMLHPPVNPAWKACWEVLVVCGCTVISLRVTGKGCSESLPWMALGVKDCGKLSHIVEEREMRFVCIF